MSDRLEEIKAAFLVAVAADEGATRVERTAAAILAGYIDCKGCNGTGELAISPPGNGCAVCCTTGILPRRDPARSAK